MVRNRSTIPRAAVLCLAGWIAACARSTAEWEADLANPRTDLFHGGLAAIALAEQAPDRASGSVRPLLGLLDGPEGPLRPHAADALRKIAPWSAEEMVRTLARSSYLSDELRTALEDAIVSAGERAVPPLLAEIADPDRLGNRALGVLLARIGEPAVDPLIELARKDPRSRTGTIAMWTLGRCGPAARRALPMLLESARGDDLPVALTALDSVWGIDPDGETVLPALREVLASPRPALRAAAAKSIAHLLVIRASRAEGPARDAILHEIVRLGDPVLPSLFEELSSPEAARGPAAREALLGVVARWPLLPRTAPRPPRSVPQALARLENPNEGARATAVLDLGRRGASELGMLPWLGRTLDDSSPVVRQATALAFALVVIDLGRAGASAAGGAR